jgi:hypothetical protein
MVGLGVLTPGDGVEDRQGTQTEENKQRVESMWCCAVMKKHRRTSVAYELRFGGDAMV